MDVAYRHPLGEEPNVSVGQAVSFGNCCSLLPSHCGQDCFREQCSIRRNALKKSRAALPKAGGLNGPFEMNSVSRATPPRCSLNGSEERLKA